MFSLKDMLHAIVGGAPLGNIAQKPSGKAQIGGNPQMQPNTMRRTAIPMVDYKQFKPMPYALPRNPDGTGGGYSFERPQSIQRQFGVQPNFGMQGFGQGQEDDYTPYDALTRRSYNNQQTTRHGDLMQPLNGDYGVQTSMHGGVLQNGFDSPYQSELQKRLRVR